MQNSIQTDTPPVMQNGSKRFAKALTAIILAGALAMAVVPAYAVNALMGDTVPQEQQAPATFQEEFLG